MAGGEAWTPPEDYEDKSSQMQMIGIIVTIVMVCSFILICVALYWKKWMKERAGNKANKAQMDQELPNLEELDDDDVSDESREQSGKLNKVKI